MPSLLWTQKQDVGPQPRTSAGLVFESGSSKTLLFGGTVPGGSAFGDTWEWDGEDWTQVADIGPSPRSGFGLACDDGRGRVVLFGGIAGDGTLFGDTWEWDESAWTQMSDDGPCARNGHALAFDADTTSTLMFGGAAANGALQGDTWTWDGKDWTQQDESGPSARQGHSLVFDSERSQAVLFGGDTGTEAVGDTWTWDGKNWTERAHFGPPAGAGAAMVFDNDTVLLYGGASSLTEAGAQVFGGSWEWDGEHWTERQDIGPHARWGHVMVFDDVRTCAVLFGGASVAPADAKVSSHLFGDTWETPTGKAGSHVGAAIFATSLNVVPSKAPAGGPVTIMVGLNSAPPKAVTVDVTVDGLNEGVHVDVAAGTTSGSVVYVVPDVPPGMAFSFATMIDGVVPPLGSPTAVLVVS